MKKKIIIAICILAVLVGAACAVDMYRMSNNEPVVFSTWGRKYAPPIDESSVIPEPTEDLSEIPGGTTHVVDIWDRTKTEQIACDTALEKFWEDETNEYYFACIKSQYIIVMDSTGKTVDVVTALNEGLITIETLDSYGIKYDTRPKS